MCRWEPVLISWGFSYINGYNQGCDFGTKSSIFGNAWLRQRSITFWQCFVILYIVVLWRLRRVVGFQFDLHIRNSYHNILTILIISDTGKISQVLASPTFMGLSQLTQQMADLWYGMDITCSPIRLELIISQQFDMGKKSFYLETKVRFRFESLTFR